MLMTAEAKIIIIIFMKTDIVKFENLKPHLSPMAQLLKCSFTKSYRYLYSTIQDT